MSNKLITTYNGGFTILPNSFIMNPHISSEAKCLMLLLMQYAWNGNDDVFPSVETIIYHLNWSKDRFQKYKKELTEKGFIVVSQAKSEQGQFSHNIYKLSPEKEYIPTEAGNCVPGESDSNNTKYIYNNINNNINNKKRIEAEKAASEVIEIFEYWNTKKNLRTHKKLDDKMHKAVIKALKNYHIDDILDAIDRYDEILGSDYYFNTVWSLDKFLRQQNALPDFLEDGTKWLSYKADKKSKNKKSNLHDESDLKGTTRHTNGRK